MPFGWLNWRLFRFVFNTFVCCYLLLSSEHLRWDVTVGQSCSAWRSRSMAESEQCSVCSHQQMQNIPMSEKPRKSPSNAEQKKSKHEVFPLTSIPCLNLSGWVGMWLCLKGKNVDEGWKALFSQKDSVIIPPWPRFTSHRLKKQKLGEKKIHLGLAVAVSGKILEEIFQPAVINGDKPTDNSQSVWE